VSDGGTTTSALVGAPVMGTGGCREPCVSISHFGALPGSWATVGWRQFKTSHGESKGTSGVRTPLRRAGSARWVPSPGAARGVLQRSPSSQQGTGQKAHGNPRVGSELSVCAGREVRCLKRGSENGGDHPKQGRRGEKEPHAASHLGRSPQGNPGLCSVDKAPAAVTSVGRSESPLDSICLSESEKTAVLTLIREEVTAGDPPPSPDPRWLLLRGELGQLCSPRGSGPLRIGGVGQQGKPPGARPKGPVSAAT